MLQNAQRRRWNVRRMLGVTSLAGALLCAGLAVASLPSVNTAFESDDNHASQVADRDLLNHGHSGTIELSGVHVVVDPESGVLRAPIGNELAEMQSSFSQLLRQDDEGLVAETLADGSRKVMLDGRYLTASVIRVNPDGTASFASVRTPEAAMAHVTGTNALEVE
ncbi:MAG: hypothetical protein AAF772_09025 [Acidobacteriota bacterium]